MSNSYIELALALLAPGKFLMIVPLWKRMCPQKTCCPQSHPFIMVSASPVFLPFISSFISVIVVVSSLVHILSASFCWCSQNSSIEPCTLVHWGLQYWLNYSRASPLWGNWLIMYGFRGAHSICVKINETRCIKEYSLMQKFTRMAILHRLELVFIL